MHRRYCVNQTRFDWMPLTQTCWKKIILVVKSIGYRNSSVNALHRACVTMSVQCGTFDSTGSSKGHRSIDRPIWCQWQQRRQKSCDTAQFQFRLSTPRRRCADRSVGSDRADMRNQCRSFDRSVVWRRFLRRCSGRLGYVDDRWHFAEIDEPPRLWYRSYSLIFLTDFRREIRTRRSLLNPDSHFRSKKVQAKLLWYFSIQLQIACIKIHLLIHSNCFYTDISKTVYLHTLYFNWVLAKKNLVSYKR